MTKHLEEILHLDQELSELMSEQYMFNEEEVVIKYEDLDVHNKTIDLIMKMTLQERVESLKRCHAIWSFVDIKPFLKKYPLNKAKLKKEGNYIEEYLNLRKFCNIVVDNFEDLSEYEEVMEILKIDDVEDYLLNHMSSEQIYELAQKTEDWNLRLFYYSYIK